MSNDTQLYDNPSTEEQTEPIYQPGVKRLTLSFYKYHNITNPDIFRDHVYTQWHTLNILGRIFIAHEGINAQLSVAAHEFDIFKKSLDDITFLKGIRLNIAIEHFDKSFLKLKIKVRSKILADGLDDKTFDPTDVGVHLNAKEFNNMIADPNTCLLYTSPSPRDLSTSRMPSSA